MARGSSVGREGTMNPVSYRSVRDRVLGIWGIAGLIIIAAALTELA